MITNTANVFKNIGVGYLITIIATRDVCPISSLEPLSTDFFKAEASMHNCKTTPLLALIMAYSLHKGECEYASSALCETDAVQATAVGRRKFIQS